MIVSSGDWTKTQALLAFAGNKVRLLKSSRSGKKRQRIDIVAVCSAKLPRPEFMFEAKLLRKNGFPVSLYVGDEGMLCFIRNEYAASYPAAAMIGYLQSDDANRWFNELERVFSNDVAGDLRIKLPLRKVKVLAPLEEEWISEHGRVNNSDIQLFHILLDCTQTVI